MKYDKINGDVGFLEGPHKYVNLKDDSINYTSVTTMIEKYGADFDSDFWSKYKALEKLIDPSDFKIEKKSLLKTKRFDMRILDAYDIAESEFNKTQQQILDDWAEENRKSCERGTKIHSKLENQFYKEGKNVTLNKFGIGGKFECRKDYSDLDLEYGVYPEYLIYYDNPKIDLHIAGQVDLIVKSGNDIYIVDHKGLPLDTEIPTEEGWKTMKSLKVGDKVFDKDGNLCNVIVKSKIHNNPCYKITFTKDFSITADCDHRWLISFSTHPNDPIYHGSLKTQIMTTKELANYLKTYNKNNQYQVPKIYINNKLNLKEKELPIDPYVLGLWLGDGTSDNGKITQQLNAKSWEEIQKRGYEISHNQEYRENVKAETKNIYGLMHQLRELGLLKNKHIPDIYQRGSFNQRLELLQGLMDADGFFDKTHQRYIMSTDYEWQAKGMVKLLSSLGVKSTINYVFRPGINNMARKCWDIKFKTTEFNPFLTRNQDCIITKDTAQSHYYSIKSVEETEIVPTQCIQVDSPSHTYLCTEHMLVTHNTNKEIKLKGFYDSSIRSEQKMKYPLSNLGDCNYNHYQLQLSTYAWMLQKINPDFVIKDLILNHYDHDGNNTIYHCQYLKDDVEKMLKHFAKQVKLEKQKAKYARIEY